MFTGLVEAMGTVRALEQQGGDARIYLEVPFATALEHGESVAINGVCLTVTDADENGMWADIMPETLRVTTLGGLNCGEHVNLERALPAGGRLGGHIVAGHVDGVGTIVSREPGPRWDVVRITMPAQVAPLVAYKGSITVSGVSLTVSAVATDWFEVSLIPETLRATTLGQLEVGDQVNLEVDVIARYVQRLQAMSGLQVGVESPDGGAVDQTEAASTESEIEE